jgi:hypothetical protein
MEELKLSECKWPEVYISIPKEIAEESLQYQNKMTAVKQLLKELQEKFPKQMADMYDSNQLLLEDIALKAAKMQKLTMVNALVEFSKANFDIHTEEAISYITDKAEQYYNETFKSK